MFVHAIVIDRNEMDEWAALYVGAAAVCTGIARWSAGRWMRPLETACQV